MKTAQFDSNGQLMDPRCSHVKDRWRNYTKVKCPECGKVVRSHNKKGTYPRHIHSLKHVGGGWTESIICNMSYLKVVTILILLFTTTATAQVVEVTSSDGGEGMGTVIHIGEPTGKYFYGYVVTASHVCPGDSNHKVTYSNGFTANNCTVVERNIERDIAILWVLVPAGEKTHSVREKPVDVGGELKFVGKDRRTFTGTASVATSDKTIFSDTELKSGDSGGPVIVEGQLVGVISGGWLWIEPGRTWPARASNVGPIRRLLNKAIRR